MPPAATLGHPPRIPAHHARLVVPAFALLLLATLQWLLDTEHARDMRLHDLFVTQAAFARETGLGIARAATGDGGLLPRVPVQAARAALARARSEIRPPLLPGDLDPAAALVDLDTRWRRLAERIHGLRAARLRQTEVRRRLARFEDVAAKLVLRSDDLLRALERDNESDAVMRIAGRQLALAQRIEDGARRALTPGADVLTAADRLGRDAVYFAGANDALQNGRQDGATERVRSDAAHDVLRAIGELYREAAAQLEGVMSDAVALQGEQGARQAALAGVDRIVAMAAHEGAVAAARAAGRPLTPKLRDLLAALALLALLGAAPPMLRDARLRRAEQLRLAFEDRVRGEQEAARTQETAEREAALGADTHALSATLERIRDGELDTRCEGACGPLATLAGQLDETLRALVARLRDARRSAIETGQAARRARDDVARVRELADEHAEGTAATLQQVRAELTRSTAQRGALRELQERAFTAGQTTGTARDEAHAVLAAAGTTAQALHEATRLLVLLRERDAELEQLARLLDDLADEGRILGLNLAIQSGTADVGRGTTALADGMRRLAENAAGLQRRTAALAGGIGRATTEALQALERGTTELAGATDIGVRCLAKAREGVDLIDELRRTAVGLVQGAAARTGPHEEGPGEGTERVERGARRLRAGALEAQATARRAAELSELVDAQLRGFTLPGLEESNVVDIRGFLHQP